MRTESRLGRPYKITPKMSSLCDNVSLILTPELVVVEESPRVKIPDAVELDSQISINMGIKVDQIFEAVKSQSLSPDYVDLIVVSQIHLLRKSFVLKRIPITQLAETDEKLVLDVDLPAWISGSLRATYTTLGVYFVLNQSMERQGINPNLVGTWLSRKKFSFGKDDPRGFGITVEPLTEQHYTQGISRDAKWFLHLAGNFVSDALETVEFKIYLNPEFLTRLTHCHDPKIRASMYSEITYVALDTIIRKLERDLSEIESLEELPGTLALVIVENVAKMTKQNPETVFNSVRSGDLDSLLSRVQGAAGVLASGLDLLTIDDGDDEE
jgi:hypothetical protein